MSGKENGAEIISEMAESKSIIRALVNQVQNFGGQADDFLILGKPESSQHLIEVARQVVKAGKLSRGIYPVIVNYDLSLEMMMIFAQLFCQDITRERFPIEGSGQADVDLKVFPPQPYFSTPRVLEAIEKEGLRFATLAEGFAFAAEYPDIQKRKHIFILGSVWEDRIYGRKCYPCFYGNGLDRILSTHSHKIHETPPDTWGDSSYFLCAVK